MMAGGPGGRSHLRLDDGVVSSLVLRMGSAGHEAWRQVPSPRVNPLPSRAPAAPEGADLDSELELAFAPLHKRAFGLAIGAALGLLILAVTWVHLLLAPADLEGPNLWLLGHFFYGYRVTPAGSLVGLAWGGFVGFVAGWFFAFCRNLVIATSIFVTRARAELLETRDFLDHI
jgi:hypothetical protein